MAENRGLDVDKESHPRLLALTEWLVTHGRVSLTFSPWSPKSNRPSVTNQGHHPYFIYG
jgi:hypothetical protein